MERVNDPLLGGDSRKRNNPILNSVMLGCMMFFILFFSIATPNQLSSDVEGIFIYLVYVIAILGSPLLISRIREKLAMLISTILFFITFLIFVYASSADLVSIIISPFALELLWISAGAFIFYISDKTNIGLNFGIFFSVTQLLQGLFQFTLNKVQSESNVGFIIMFIIFLIIGVLLILLLGNPSRIRGDGLGSDLVEELISPFKVVFDKKFLFIIPSIVFIGFSSQFGITGVVTVDQYVFIGVNILVSTLTPLIIGFLFDRLKKMFVVIILLVMGILAIIASHIYVYDSDEDQNHTSYFYVAYITYTILKLGMTVFVYSLVGYLYQKKPLPSNAAIQFVTVTGLVLAFVFTYFVSNFYIGFYVLTGLLVITCILLLYLTKKYDY
ncbi:hypothetical protein RB653_007298 [Dictyostelium firmibasis]|uniref:Uncharacterized protein n=1 Tax=Dictyostelium firmibasis TaxID=79012 RepID=A0AAN7YUI8_9MYCE